MKKRTTGIIIFIALFIGLCGVVTWLFYSGRLAYMDPAKVVCGKAIISKYNNAIDYQYREGSDESTIDEAGVKIIVTDIKANAKSKYDPTCQSILFWSAVRSDNYSEAKSAYDIIKGLNEKRIFIDSSLHDAAPLFTLVNSLNGLTGSGAENNEPLGG
jgi:hypothetical protein